MSVKPIELTGVIAKDKGEEYYALCIELNVASHGRTISEARRMLKEAIVLYLETCVEEGVSFLRPVTPDDNPLISNPTFVKDVFKLTVKLSAKTSVKTTSCKACSSN